MASRTHTCRRRAPSLMHSVCHKPMHICNSCAPLRITSDRAPLGPAPQHPVAAFW